jgi:hypothetical protein
MKLTATKVYGRLSPGFKLIYNNAYDRTGKYQNLIDDLKNAIINNF